MMKPALPLSLALLLLLPACQRQRDTGDNGAFLTKTSAPNGAYDMEAIRQSGELIVGTLSGPDTYFDYQGQPMGLQYALAADFAHREGLTLRMETAHDTAELVSLLRKGDIDVVALPLSAQRIADGHLAAAGVVDTTQSAGWAVRAENTELAAALREWYATHPRAEVARREQQRFSERRQVRRHVHAAYVSQEKGIISPYDGALRQAAAALGWDWRLLAAQCYSESGFDPMAVSWAGARGLMQIMPSTARTLGVSPEQLYSPDVNIQTAGRYLKQLNETFNDIRSREERLKFVLAAYNGGAGHVRDAMALARKYGHDATRWDQVDVFVRRLSEARYYRDPVVRNGYMIGSETSGYVATVMERWRAYGGRPGSGTVGDDAVAPSHPSYKRNRFSRDSKIYRPEELEAGAAQEAG
jgi:membrane-bound lytic murein transglycosylase F